MARADVDVLWESLRLRFAGMTFTKEDAGELIRRFRTQVALQTRPTSTEIMEPPLIAAERHLNRARLELYLSPFDEKVVDVLDSLIKHAKTT